MAGRLATIIAFCLLSFTPGAARPAAHDPSLAASTAEIVDSSPAVSTLAIPDSSLTDGPSAPADSGLAAAASAAPGAGFTSQRASPSLASQIIVTEAALLLLSSAAFADDKGTLPGITIATILLGSASGGISDLKSPKSPWLLLGGMAAITTAEFVLANSGASKGALFATSMGSWNAVLLAIGLEERKARGPK